MQACGLVTAADGDPRSSWGIKALKPNFTRRRTLRGSLKTQAFQLTVTGIMFGVLGGFVFHQDFDCWKSDMKRKRDFFLIVNSNSL